MRSDVDIDVPIGNEFQSLISLNKRCGMMWTRLRRLERKSEISTTIDGRRPPSPVWLFQEVYLESPLSSLRGQQTPTACAFCVGSCCSHIHRVTAFPAQCHCNAGACRS